MTKRVLFISLAFLISSMGFAAYAQQCVGNGCEFIQVRKSKGCIVLRNTHKTSAIKVTAPRRGAPTFVWTVYSNSEEVATHAFTGACIKNWYSTGHEAVLLSPTNESQTQTPRPDPRYTRKTPLERFGARIELHYACRYPADIQVYYTDNEGAFRKAPLVSADPNHAIKLDRSVLAKSKTIYVYGQIRGNGPPNTYVYEWEGDPDDPASRMLQYKGGNYRFRPMKMSYDGGLWLGFSLSCPGLSLPPSFLESGIEPYYPDGTVGGNSAPRRNTDGEPIGRPVGGGAGCRGRDC